MIFEKKNILIGITSSIAAYKIYDLIRMFIKAGFSVKTILSPNALNFVSPLAIETLSNSNCFYDQFAPRVDVEHIELIKWADVFLIAPATANTISKAAMGIADNLLTSTICAYIGSKKPILFAPAMNTNMWNNPIIIDNIEKLKNIGVGFVEPIDGILACGDTGVGKLADIETIFHKTIRTILEKKENNNKKIIVTYGGTREKIDSVRYITNSSSGKMGYNLALWAYYSGYDVISVSTIEKYTPFKNIVVQSAQNMLDELQKLDFNYLIMAAAVGDFRTKNMNKYKISKENLEKDFSLELTLNPDIVFEIAKNKKKNQKIIGFCLTDKDLIETAKKKLKNKKLDYIVANDVITALNTNQNKVTIIEKSGKMIDIGLDDKSIVAKKILEVVCD